MKTFTEAEKREIEQRIQSACAGTKFEGPKPEMFLSATQGELFHCHIVRTELQVPILCLSWSYKTPKQVMHFQHATEFWLN